MIHNPFTLITTDEKTSARYGQLQTVHKVVETPAFMPVGTYGTVRILSREDLIDAACQIITSNAYHLYLKPGMDTIDAAGGLHRFMNWDGGIFTDSGGFQIYSLSSLRKVTTEGIRFQSHLDGSHHFLSPEHVMDIGFTLGSDFLVPLDKCISYPAERSDTEGALNITHDWACRTKVYFDKKVTPHTDGSRQLLFGIVQGGMFKDLRAQAVEQTASLSFDGYAIGGVSVGEPRDVLYDITASTAALLPQEAIRYLMGVGTPIDIIEAVSRGVDLFDCVIPTRNGRNGLAYTFNGPVYLRTERDGACDGPIEEGCACEACRNYSRRYIRHIFKVGELLALRMTSVHNIYFYMRFMASIRQSIREGRFSEFKADIIENYRKDT